MNNSILVDTNVLIYAVDADSRFHDKAIKLLSDPTSKLFTTSKNISEFLVVLTRNEEIKLPTAEWLEILNNILLDIVVLFPNPMTMKVFHDLIRKYNPVVYGFMMWK